MDRRRDCLSARAHYGKATNAELADEFGRSIDAFEVKASRLGLARQVIEVTPAMERAVVRSLGEKDLAAIARELGPLIRRTRKIAFDHGFRARPTSRRWSAAEDEILREWFPAMTNAEIAERMVRTELAIVTRARELGLCRPRIEPRRRAAHRPWTADEEKLLNRLYGTMLQKKIVERLGRTSGAIFTRVSLLGLTKGEDDDHIPRKRRVSG